MEGMKNIFMCDVFYQMVLEIIRHALETFSGNKYVIVVIDHYSKWCETHLIR